MSEKLLVSTQHLRSLLDVNRLFTFKDVFTQIIMDVPSAAIQLTSHKLEKLVESIV